MGTHERLNTSLELNSPFLRPNLKMFLHHKNTVQPGYADSVEYFKNFVMPFGWYPLWIRMMSYDPTVRPTPSEITNSGLMKWLEASEPLKPVPADLFAPT